MLQKNYLLRQKWWIAGTLLGFALAILVALTVAAARLGAPDAFSGPLTTTVDPIHHQIIDSPDDPALDAPSNLQASLWNAFELSGLRAAALQAYENLSGSGNVVVTIHPGMRKEEVAEVFANKLHWDDAAKSAFIALSPADIQNSEGHFYPDTYVVASTTTPLAVQQIMAARFLREVAARYPASTAAQVNMNIALTIASIIQREAAGKQDMRVISGVIWNRLFKDQALDIDATLQYVKGSQRLGWWPRLTSKDKFIDSPYNTYKYGGLPPTAISNPSLAALAAALKPKKITAMFYLHDRTRHIHTAVTYKQHLANIARYY